MEVREERRGEESKAYLLWAETLGSVLDGRCFTAWEVSATRIGVSVSVCAPTRGQKGGDGCGE
jgi:hypothetical protein